MNDDNDKSDGSSNPSVSPAESKTTINSKELRKERLQMKKMKSEKRKKQFGKIKMRQKRNKMKALKKSLDSSD